MRTICGMPNKPISRSIYEVSGDIAQKCDGAEVTYFHSASPVNMVVNIFNASSTCVITAKLKDKYGRVIVSETINHRDTAIDPGSDPPGQTDVVNQQKTIAAAYVVELTITCDCTDSSCSTDNECVGRYMGQAVFV